MYISSNSYTYSLSSLFRTTFPSSFASCKSTSSSLIEVKLLDDVLELLPAVDGIIPLLVEATSSGATGSPYGLLFC